MSTATIDVNELRVAAMAACSVRWFIAPQAETLSYVPLIAYGDKRSFAERPTAHGEFIDATQPECIITLCDEIARLRNMSAQSTGMVSATIVEDLKKLVSQQERELGEQRKQLAQMSHAFHEMNERLTASISMRLICPSCKALHIDEGEFKTKSHHTHACQSCGNVWRPAIVNTVGVMFLPGFKSEEIEF